MVVGVAREIKDHETGRAGSERRHRSARGRHEVLVEARAGEGSSISDEEYARAGARIVTAPRRCGPRPTWSPKVKEPQPAEYAFFRPGLVLFTYLHLAPFRS